MKVEPVLVSADNYAYFVIDETSKEAAVVDPLNFSKVRGAAQELGVSIIACITTHHHPDHSGGNKDFAAAFPDAPIYGGSDKVLAANKIVGDNDSFTISKSLSVKCLATPCHTRDSICYYVTDSSNPSQPGAVFTGDTLFQGGCGRFFEGNGAEMHAALTKLGRLPNETVVYNGHEYTTGNVAFARSVDPENAAIKKLHEMSQQNQATCGLTTIEDEKEFNVFMRLDSDAVKKATGESEPTAVMDKLREMKNSFRA
ncbi:hydroxyacylglutathione hydrolase [Coniophora puteana RWD-64-598 SS2]|uniref:hydroxyacylglutathione hydrolase n=1 Tax=Coniophora puteana (strain RWD-64-598) TaxID=741705 RepID=A0A5M3N261_CONPW|nr:hydroxyacylglutathione hydrolase [Coniophora puteana RWD-64-598 SS2]EIW85396.1 hydroxyacylglutathione hydrolase [Coniophora puteana RWD-64-598 SS2]